jgi:hypothetical protein
MLNLVYDRSGPAGPYPNLVPWKDTRTGYSDIGDEYPFLCPIRIFYYAKDHGFPINISYTNEALPANAFYPVGISWFDFSLDFFALMSEQVQNYLREGKLRALFYYHEGDNPHHEKARLDQLCAEHNLPVDCYRFISGNTEADGIDNFVYFADHELFYWRNSVVWNDIPQPGCEVHPFRRNREFTLLSRVHKWWRSTIVSHLYSNQLLGNSYWSYGNVDIGDQYTDNPIQLHQFPKLETFMKDFLAAGPYKCDEQDATEHNSHWMFVPEHYNDSYCHLVLETFFDADGSNGCFISEKVFKPIRHGQPFIVFGTPHTLATLRRLGYRTYDYAIDNSYDSIEDNTERFRAVVESVRKVFNQDMHTWYMSMRDDMQYNRQLYLSTLDKKTKLAELVKSIL